MSENDDNAADPSVNTPSEDVNDAPGQVVGAVGDQDGSAWLNENRRRQALELACQGTWQGMNAKTVLERAQTFETYLLDGTLPTT